MDERGLNVAFGRRVQALREARSLTQEQLAVAIERTVHTIGNIERGVASTRIGTADRLARALGVSLPELFEFGDGPDAHRARRRAIAAASMTLAGLCDEKFDLVMQTLDTTLRLAGRDGRKP